MGMFDYVTSLIPLPNGKTNEQGQTKNFGCNLDTLVIDQDGQFWERENGGLVKSTVTTEIPYFDFHLDEPGEPDTEGYTAHIVNGKFSHWSGPNPIVLDSPQELEGCHSITENA